MNTVEQRGNVRLLRSALFTNSELLLAVAVARRPSGRFRSGLLAATTARVLFVQERSLGKPIMTAHRYSEIEKVTLSHTTTGALTFAASGHTLRYDLIRPLERAWPLYWRISERIGQLPLREHR